MERRCGSLVFGQQAQICENINQRGPSAQISVPPPPHRPRIAPVDGQTGARLGISPVGKDANANIADRIAIIQTPADRVCAYI
nr:hypothetical protein [uncultured Sphingomonas sp.]